MIALKDIHMSFQRTIFDNCSIDIQDGLFTTIDGKSGCGKTVLLKLIMGELVPQSGQILYDGQSFNQEERDHYIFHHIAYVDQVGSYYPNMTIKEHFDFYAQVYGIEDVDIEKWLQTVYMDKIDINQSPSVLSTGQRKRFLIALALFVDKEMIILDEPTASLDDESTQIILDLLKECVEEKHKTVICSTHDQSVIDISDQVYLIENEKILLKSDKHKDINKINKTQKSRNKVSYYKYKKMNQKIFSLIIIIIQCISITLSSLMFSTFLSNSSSSINEFETSNNTGLILTKLLDDRNIAGGMDSEGYDFISEEEINEIKKIDGVEHVDEYYCLSFLLGSYNIGIQEEGKEIKTIKNEFVDPDNQALLMADFYIMSYYPYQNIKHNGKNIDGIYISENFKYLFDGDLSGKSLVLKGSIPVSMKLSKEDIAISEDSNGDGILDKNDKALIYHNVPQYKIEFSEVQDFSFQISDYLFENEYNPIPTEQSLKSVQHMCIYMPVEQVKELLEKNSNKKSPYLTREYIIYCDSQKKEQARIEIENLNPLYKVKDQGNESYELRKFDISQLSSQMIMTMIICFILFMITIIFHIYQTLNRKKEIDKLRCDGLYSYVYQYFMKDSYIFMIVSLFVSIIGLWLANDYFGKTFDSFMFIEIWLISTIIMEVLFYIIDHITMKRLIKRS